MDRAGLDLLGLLACQVASPVPLPARPCGCERPEVWRSQRQGPVLTRRQPASLQDSHTANHSQDVVGLVGSNLKAFNWGGADNLSVEDYGCPRCLGHDSDRGVSTR